MVWERSRKEGKEKGERERERDRAGMTDSTLRSREKTQLNSTTMSAHIETGTHISSMFALDWIASRITPFSLFPVHRFHRYDPSKRWVTIKDRKKKENRDDGPNVSPFVPSFHLTHTVRDNDERFGRCDVSLFCGVAHPLSYPLAPPHMKFKVKLHEKGASFSIELRMRSIYLFLDSGTRWSKLCLGPSPPNLAVVVPDRIWD